MNTIINVIEREEPEFKRLSLLCHTAYLKAEEHKAQEIEEMARLRMITASYHFGKTSLYEDADSAYLEKERANWWKSW